MLPTLVSDSTFFIGFATIGVTGLLAGLIALGGPRTSGRSLEQSHAAPAAQIVGTGVI